MTPEKEFVELDKLLHDRKSFNCGQPELNGFLAGSAARHREAGISRTMVLPTDSGDEPVGICAYYTLSHTEIKRDIPPVQLVKKLPRYPLPVILIVQLAVHKAVQGKGLGKITLISALEHTLRINEHLPFFAVIVDALNSDIQSFFEQYGFQTLYRHNDRQRLFLPMKTIAQLFNEEP